MGILNPSDFLKAAQKRRNWETVPVCWNGTQSKTAKQWNGRDDCNGI